MLRHRRGGRPRVLAPPNGFLRDIVAQRYGDELRRYAASIGIHRVALVVDPGIANRTATAERLFRFPRIGALEVADATEALRAPAQDLGVSRRI